ncbi:hypothetical protein Taro_018665 [Colocasia esculenta]|uniref:Uncharacterized protein n=1 Tax=Colocasia esculenta TaxID=4460 RepID=A0A843UUE4_COLES|nr:hypothetical protein [Colocasia esculenta]
MFRYLPCRVSLHGHKISKYQMFLCSKCFHVKLVSVRVNLCAHMCTSFKGNSAHAEKMCVFYGETLSIRRLCLKINMTICSSNICSCVFVRKFCPCGSSVQIRNIFKHQIILWVHTLLLQNS